MSLGFEGLGVEGLRGFREFRGLGFRVLGFEVVKGV